MERYTDTISGEELYLDKGPGWEYYYKDEAMAIAHRVDGPAAIVANRYEEWFCNNRKHRIDGPAVEYAAYIGGDKEWYVNDVFIIQVNKDGKIIDRMK